MLSSLAVVCYYSVGSQALVTVPDPPAYATLDAIGSGSLEVSVSTPLSDGGTPITSYTVGNLTFVGIFDTIKYIFISKAKYCEILKCIG